MSAHIVKWLEPSPLWREAESAPALLLKPALLRFATDTFMEDFLALLERDPESVTELRAQYETWRDPVAGSSKLAQPIAVEREPRRVLDFARQRLRQTRRTLSAPTSRGSTASTASTNAPYQLKLYQPAHQRYYLVTSSLVCALPGFPDRSVNFGQRERVSFVMRRLVPHAGQLTDALPELDPDDLSSWDEYAFVATPQGASWRKADAADSARVPGEEPLPLFPCGFRDALGKQRRMFAGMIPVARREAYLGAPIERTGGDDDGAGTDDTKPSDPRRLLFLTQVIAPWKSLIATGALAQGKANQGAPDGIDDDAAARTAGAVKIRKTAREQIQTGSWYLLLDFAELLGKYLPTVLDALTGGTPSLSSAEHAVFDALDGIALPGVASLLTSASEQVSTVVYASSDVAGSFGDALKRVMTTGNATRLETATTSYDREGSDAKTTWPDFLFPVSDPSLSSPTLGALLPKSSAILTSGDPIEALFPPLDRLAELIGAALPALGSEPQPAVAANGRTNIDPRDAWFVIRCVYEQPECGKLHPSALSAPSVPFQLAAFFDPDAPARPIRIGLPIDPTPAGLRKFDKKTFMMVSNVLCGHIDRVKQLSLADLVLSVLPWPFHKDLSVPDRGPCKTGSPELSLGLMCSLSLPIITICALLLLMIMVSLLDLIFRWIPYFIVCFPLPGFSGKKGART